MEVLAKEGYNPQYGARPLKRLIQSKILTSIASMMISKGVLKGGTVTVGHKNGEFTFDIKKGKKGSLWAENLIDTPKTA
jgi:ATP-dependent Clp protease ATP-binding subunit ClpC